jgi:hypothetical protein
MKLIKTEAAAPKSIAPTKSNTRFLINSKIDESFTIAKAISKIAYARNAALHPKTAH